MITRYDLDIRDGRGAERTAERVESADGDYVLHADLPAYVEAAIAARVASGELVALPEGRETRWRADDDAHPAHPIHLLIDEDGKIIAVSSWSIFTGAPTSKTEAIELEIARNKNQVEKLQQTIASLLRARRELEAQDGK